MASWTQKKNLMDLFNREEEVFWKMFVTDWALSRGEENCQGSSAEFFVPKIKQKEWREGGGMVER